VEHIVLTVLAVGIGFLISFALAIAITRRRWLYGPVTATAGIVYTIPSLALFAILVPITGLTILTAEIALVGYTILILVRNIVAALDGVPAEVREAADAMGYSRWARLWRVELPLATPVIVAGLRIATVTTVGLVTVSALIGQGGLGDLIQDGIRRFFPTMIVLGAVLSVALAVVADVLLLALQRLVTPWTRARGGAG
jgi:osmoprotectant transport system permease protein